MTDSVTEISALAKYYGSVTGVEDLSSPVGEGEVFGSIAPNGAGKRATSRFPRDTPSLSGPGP